jgi:membrane-bound serine protease (ClpP class)
MNEDADTDEEVIGLISRNASCHAVGDRLSDGVLSWAEHLQRALMMFPARAPGFTLSGGVIAGAAIGSAALLLLVLAALLRSRERPVVTGSEALIGAEGEIVSWQGGDGRVRVKGEIWLARN